jgi:hypothetical protein
MTTHTGGCHCGAVRYSVTGEITNPITCNCSHCSKKGFILWFVDNAAFTLEQGADTLTSYQFNKKQIDHVFCKQCGTQSFARGVAFPQVAINVRCLDNIDVNALTTTEYNGKEV